MWRALAAALAVAAGSPQSPPIAPASPPGAGPVAISPNIAIDTCPGGGTQVSLWPTMPPRTIHAALRGDVAGDVLWDAWCPGFYPRAPQFCLDVSAPGGWYTIEIVDARGVDTTLAVVGGSLTAPVCDDDSAAELRSRLVVWLDAGRHDLHAGSIGQGGSAPIAVSFQAGELW